MTSPHRGFTDEEFHNRLARAQRAMDQAGLDALLLTTHPDIYYFTGYLTRFWESPTRPWFLLVPASGLPVAVIPSIGAQLMAATWITDIRTWSAPDLEDDGISLLADTITEVVGKGRIGLPSGHETHVRMPLADFDNLKGLLPHVAMDADAGIVRALRMVKSDAEIAKITQACRIAERSFARMHEIAREGVTLDEVFRRFQILCLEEGADYVPYLAGGAGPDGYRDVITPATPTPLTTGDVFMLDTGLVWDGYFCDFDRNFSIGAPAEHIAAAGHQLLEATQAGFEAARPGKRACDVFQAMNQVLSSKTAPADSGRLGHGLGIQLTEWPSLMAADETVLQPGMVLTLEPVAPTRNCCMLVHEENIVVTETGGHYLTHSNRLPEVVGG
ncbi:MAG: M24 family metallopeptidase [Hyphomicrobiaceae bacterium]